MPPGLAPVREVVEQPLWEVVEPPLREAAGLPSRWRWAGAAVVKSLVGGTPPLPW